MEYKAPTIAKEYTVEFAADLDTGVTIASCVWTLDTGLTEDSETIGGTTATITVSGGTAGIVYRVKATATDSGGELHVENFDVTIQNNIN